MRATDRADQRFPKARRVRRREEYVATQRSSARVVTPHFVLLFRAVPGEGTRLGVTASAKQVGNAVARNRAKRLVREAFRLSPELFPALPGLRVDVVVIVRSHPGELVLQQVLAEWTKAAPAIARLAPRLRPALRPAVDALLLRGYHTLPDGPARVCVPGRPSALQERSLPRGVRPSAPHPRLSAVPVALPGRAVPLLPVVLTVRVRVHRGPRRGARFLAFVHPAV